MKRIAVLSFVALFVMGFASAALAQGSVSGTYWLPGTWTLEGKADGEEFKISIPGRGLSFSGDFAFSEKLGLAFAYSRLSDTGKVTFDGMGFDNAEMEADTSGTSTMIDLSYRLYAGSIFAVSPALGYFESSMKVEGLDALDGGVTMDASGLKIGARVTATLMEGLEGYISGGYVPSLAVKSSSGGTASEGKGSATEFAGGVRYAVRVIPNLYFDGGYKYISVAADEGANTLFRDANTSGFYAGVGLKF